MGTFWPLGFRALARGAALQRHARGAGRRSANAATAPMLPADQTANVIGRHGQYVPEVLQGLFAPDGASASECCCRCVGLISEGRGMAHALERVHFWIDDECGEFYK